MGTYAQTEIGHGSNVAGIETTATFDKSTDEFIIQTPSPTATKWWPGDLGNFSSHAMTFCRLIIDGQDYGVMPFIVPLRDLDTWMPLPGISAGDMGPKMGYHSKNNGWCTFNQVRIPRENMPMKFVSVDREGNFGIEGDMRILYSVMMDIRTQLLLHSGGTLLRALTIGMRYSACRR
jgi:acyl-CoA oxidase